MLGAEVGKILVFLKKIPVKIKPGCSELDVETFFDDGQTDRQTTENKE